MLEMVKGSSSVIQIKGTLCLNPEVLARRFLHCYWRDDQERRGKEGGSRSLWEYKSFWKFSPNSSRRTPRNVEKKSVKSTCRFSFCALFEVQIFEKKFHNLFLFEDLFGFILGDCLVKACIRGKVIKTRLALKSCHLCCIFAAFHCWLIPCLVNLYQETHRKGKTTLE